MHDHPVYAQFYTTLLIKIAQRKREWVCRVTVPLSFIQIFSFAHIKCMSFQVVHMCSFSNVKRNWMSVVLLPLVTMLKIKQKYHTIWNFTKEQIQNLALWHKLDVKIIIFNYKQDPFHLNCHRDVKYALASSENFENVCLQKL